MRDPRNRQYHWSLEITMSEMSIFLDFFVMWSNQVLSFLRSALSWLEGPIQYHISSTTTSSHPILIALIPFLDNGLCLCPSCQVTWKLVEDSGYSSLGPMSWFMEWGQTVVPSETSQASCLILVYLRKDPLCFLHSKACRVFQSAPGAGCPVYKMKGTHQILS